MRDMNLQFGARGNSVRGRMAAGLQNMNLALTTGRPGLGMNCFGPGLGAIGHQQNFEVDALRFQQGCSVWAGGWTVGPNSNMNNAAGMQMNLGNMSQMCNVNRNMGSCNTNNSQHMGCHGNQSFPFRPLQNEGVNEFWDWGPKEEDESDSEVKKISSPPRVKRAYRKKSSLSSRQRSHGRRAKFHSRADDIKICAKDDEVEEGELVESYERDNTTLDWSWREKEEEMLGTKTVEENPRDGDCSDAFKSDGTSGNKKRKKSHKKRRHGHRRKFSERHDSIDVSTEKRQRKKKRKMFSTRKHMRESSLDGATEVSTVKWENETVEEQTEKWEEDVEEEDESQAKAHFHAGSPDRRDCSPDQRTKQYIKNTSHVSRHLARKLIHRACRLKRHQKGSRQDGDKWIVNGVKAGHETPASQEIGLDEDSASARKSRRPRKPPPRVITGDKGTSVSPLLYPGGSLGTGSQSPASPAKNLECHSRASSRTPSPVMVIDDNYDRPSSSTELMDARATDEVTQAHSERSTCRRFKKSVRVAKKRLFGSKGSKHNKEERFDQGEVLGDRITISWFKDLRRARQKAAQQGQNIFHGRGWGMPHSAGMKFMRPDDRGRQTQRNVSPLRNGFRPGQYKSNYRPNDQYNAQGERWQRQNSGSRGTGRRKQRDPSSSRSRSRSRSSSRTYSRSRSRSPHSASRERSRERARTKSRSRSYSRSRERSRSADSRRTPSPYITDRHTHDRDDSSDRSTRDKSTERANGTYEGKSQRWDDSKNSESYTPAAGGGGGGGESGGGERNTNGHYDQESHDRDGYDHDTSPPRNRHLRSAVTTVEREDGYDQDDEYSTDEASRRYSSLNSGSQQALQPPSSSSIAPNPNLVTAINHEATPSPVSREHVTPTSRERETEKAYGRSRSREYDQRERIPVGDRDRLSSERYPNVADGSASGVGPLELPSGGGSGSHGRDVEPPTGRSRSPDSRSERSQADQDQYDDRKRDRKRSLSEDDHGRYDEESKKGRYAEEEKEKARRPMAKRTRGAENLDEDPEERDLPDRGALGLPHDKMVMVREKKEEIEKAYRQDCETFAAVVKMLVSKDSELETKLQQSLRENLKEIGQRCIQELREFINKVRMEEQS